MKRYNHKKAARLAAKVKKLQAATKLENSHTQISKQPVKKPAAPAAVKKPLPTRKHFSKRAASASRAAFGRIAAIGGAVIGFIAIIVVIGMFVFDFDADKSGEKNKDNNTEAVEADGTVYPMATVFTREQVTSNLMINSAGNFITVENDSDYDFMDLVFRESDVDGNLIQKKVISSDYTLFTYVTRHCNDVIELADGYMLVGYAQRGDYALGKSDVNIWYAKIDFDANIIWEHITDDGYLQSQILTIEPFGDDEYRLYIHTEALKRWFLIIDSEGEQVESYDMSEEFVDYADTEDNGKVFIQKQTRDISIIKKVDADNSVEIENFVVGDYYDIYPVNDGYLLFGEVEIDDVLTSVAVMTDSGANVVWQKPVSAIGNPTVKDILYSEGDGYILTGYIYKTEGSDTCRSVPSLFDDTIQNIQDAWVAKLDESYAVSWEKTYAYGDMGALYDKIIKVSDDTYYLTGEAQYQGKDASTIVKDKIVTKITDGETTENSPFVELDSEELKSAPVVDFVNASESNYNLVDGAKSNDYALKVYWQAVEGAVEYKIDILDGGAEKVSVTTRNQDSYVIKDVISNYGLGEQMQYTCTVTAIDAQNGSMKSDPYQFTFYNPEYHIIRSWFPGFDQDNRKADFFYRLGNGASTVEIYRNQVMSDGSVDSRMVDTRHNDTIDEDFASIGYGTYYYTMKLTRDNGVILTKDTPKFTYSDPDPAGLSDIELDEERLKSDVGLNDDDIENLRLLIHLGQFDDGNRHHIRLLQLFCNYYLDDLSKLGIYSPDTEPESGLDVPIDVNNYFNEDTRKAMVYLLAYFGRTNIDGENLVNCVDENFFTDISSLHKLPIRNDIISAKRSEGSDAKYNSGYSFDTSYNYMEGIQLAVPVDHDPQKSAYFGIRYLPVINGEEYDTGVRLHSGVDYRSEDMIIDDVEYILAHAGEEYIDTEDKVEEEVTEEKTEAEIRRDRIYAPFDGVVIKTIHSEVGNGNYIELQHVTKDAEKTVFYSQSLHLSSILCSVGQTVKRGEVIGTMGNTGYSEAKHLHLEFFTEEMRVQTFLNPLIYDYAYQPLKEQALAIDDLLRSYFVDHAIEESDFLSQKQSILSKFE